MEWMSQLGGLLQQYSGAGAAQAPATVNDDFDQITQSAPQAELADGLAAAFRSDQTPDFGQMTGPMILSQVLSRRAGTSGGGGGLSSLLDLLSGGQQTQMRRRRSHLQPKRKPLQ